MRAILKSLIVLSLVVLWGGSLFAATDTATPITYEVTMKKVELRDSSGNWVTAREADLTFNIASADAGAVVGSYISGASIPVGTYDQVRATMSRDLGVQATGSVGGTTYYSTSGSTTIPGDLGSAITISTDSGDYAQGTIQIPSNVSGVDATAGTFVDTTTLSTPIIVGKGTIQSVTIKFDVTDKVTFDDGDLVCYPLEPGVTME